MRKLSLIVLSSIAITIFLGSTMVLLLPVAAYAATDNQTGSNSASTGAGIQHVIVVMMENKEFSTVIGSKKAPYENQLAKSYALATNYDAVTHPSLPNYLAQTAGTTFGLTADCIPKKCSTSATSIFNLLDAKGLTWKSYAESMPKPCDSVASGEYYPRHVPAVYYTYVTSSAKYCDAHVVPLGNVTTKTGQFYTDMASGSFPNYAFVTPNICDDAHSCPLATGDKWLSEFIPTIQSSPIYSSTVIIIVYDEGTTNIGGGGHVPLFVVGPSSLVKNTQSNVSYNDYSILATVEAIYNLGNLGRNDTTAAAMSPLFNVSI
jgi:phosphatidylinositol-3-phosphatase